MNSTPENTSMRPAETSNWLTTPIEFEEQRGLRLSRKAMRLLVVLAAGALLWAAVVPIRELSLARGQLVPLSQIRPVQHLEGGVVEQIFVEQGQLVERDQPLMRLQEVMSDSELARSTPP
jgi:membrane fusion protein, adhesin transport system